MPTTTAHGVRCGNRALHGDDRVYHTDSVAVRECFAGSTGEAAPAAVAGPDLSVLQAEQAAQQEAERRARNARFAAWRSIPVYAYNRGYYALEVNGTVHFYRVERPTEGKWAGKTFVHEQAGGSFYKMGYGPSGGVMDRIAADPAAAALLYASEIDKCSRCNRTLTDTASRERGMGPDCATKYGV